MTDRRKQQTDVKQFAAALIRVSTEEQAGEDRGGIPAQRAACKRIAEQNNLEIKWTIEIEGVSGAAVMRSPSMQELVRIVQSGQCAGIVLKEESRLMRPENFGDYSLLGTLESHNVKLFLVDTTIDLSKPDGKLWAQIKFGMSAYERTQIRDRLLDGKKAKRSRGDWVAGRNSVPLGFSLVTDSEKRKRLVVDKSTIGKVQRLFKLYVGGVTAYTELARKTGVPLHSVPYILRNHIYIGVHVVHKAVDPKENVYRLDGSLKYQRRKSIPEEDREFIQILEQPPVDPDIFAAAQQILKSQVAMRRRRSGKPEDPFVFRGFLRCAECGLPVTTYRRKAAVYEGKSVTVKCNEQEYYICRGVMGRTGKWDPEKQKFGVSLPRSSCMTRRLDREEIEKLIDHVFMAQLGNKDFTANLLKAHMAKSTPSTKGKEESLQAEITAAESAIVRNQDLYVRGRIDREGFDKNDDRLQRELNIAKAELRKLKTANVKYVSVEEWMRVASIFATWDSQSTLRKRTMLSTIAPVIEVAGYAGERYRDTILKVKSVHLSLNPDHPTIVQVESPEVIVNKQVRQ